MTTKNFEAKKKMLITFLENGRRSDHFVYVEKGILKQLWEDVAFLVGLVTGLVIGFYLGGLF